MCPCSGLSVRGLLERTENPPDRKVHSKTNAVEDNWKSTQSRTSSWAVFAVEKKNFSAERRNMPTKFVCMRNPISKTLHTNGEKRWNLQHLNPELSAENAKRQKNDVATWRNLIDIHHSNRKIVRYRVFEVYFRRWITLEISSKKSMRTNNPAD